MSSKYKISKLTSKWTFDKRNHSLFMKRLENSKNKQGLRFIKTLDFTRYGIKCGKCNISKPIYTYRQHHQISHGFCFTVCNSCRGARRNIWARLANGMIFSSKKRQMGTP
jgi:hypothetical protein